LKKVGLDETALQCGAHPPYHRPSARALRRRRRKPTALHNNCSGKHAGMLALAVQLGAPIAAYLQPAHPVQASIRARLEALAGLVGQIGAEGMYGLAFMQDGAGAGVALKIADGEGQRARFSAALEALRQLGVLAPDEAAALRARFVGELRNHGGLLVGEITTA